MSLKTSARHYNGFIIKTEIGIPWNSCIKNNFMMNRNVGSHISVRNEKKQKNNKLNSGRRKKQFKKADKFCFEF